MYWENEIWNYHRIGIFVAVFVFILVSPPVLKLIDKYTYNGYWIAFVIALLVWSFTFLFLHIYTAKGANDIIDDYD
jgi:hypothetical protein